MEKINHFNQVTIKRSFILTESAKLFRKLDGGGTKRSRGVPRRGFDV
jgi:hypothetical protein